MKNTTGRYRTKDGKAQIEWSLEEKEKGLVFSASGHYNGGGGQNLDEISKAYPQDQTVQRICKVWKRYHLNDMRAGTPEQEKVIREWLENNPNEKYDYTIACAILGQENLYIVDLPLPNDFIGRFHQPTHKYGSSWIFEPIPQEVLDEINSWNGNAQDSFYDHQAQDFLTRNNLKMRITLSDSKPANWQPAGHHYRVTISHKGISVGTSNQKRVVFDFWGSVADMEKNIDPSPYDVLACISDDVYTPETFEDFCSEYGYEQDSIKSLQTFKRCNRFAKRLREFFTENEIEQLQEIK
jgi:hypothetical protein